MSYSYRHSESYSGQSLHGGAATIEPYAGHSKSATAEPPAESSNPADELGLFPRRITRSEIIYMTNQLAIMVETGITLSVALDGIVQQEQNPTLRYVLND